MMSSDALVLITLFSFIPSLGLGLLYVKLFTYPRCGCYALPTASSGFSLEWLCRSIAGGRSFTKYRLGNERDTKRERRERRELKECGAHLISMCLLAHLETIDVLGGLLKVLWRLEVKIYIPLALDGCFFISI